LLGKNGAGKSTLIKLMSGKMKALSGEYLSSAGLHIGYFAQHQVEALEMQNSAFDHIQQMDLSMTEQAVRDYLGGFGFHGDEAMSKVGPMSGGEKARLVLAILVFQKPNLLLLDEPTNHLDIEMRAALNFALQSFEGAIVLVSHDRHLLSSVCDDFYLVDAGQVSSFSGDLDDYRKWMLTTSKANAQNVQQSPEQNRGQSRGQSRGHPNATYPQGGPAKATSSIDRKELKRLEAQFRQQTKPLTEAVKKQELRMTKLSEQKAEIETLMSDSQLYEAQNKDQLTSLISEQAKVLGDLEEAELLWLDAQESLEQAKLAFDETLEGYQRV
jgi:ATP-binding cassette subfamily F protein 3